MKQVKLLAISILTIIFIFSCKKSTNLVKINDLGFSMQLPTGWQVDTKEASLFYDTNNPEDNLGQVADYDLKEGESLIAFVDSLIADEQKIYAQEKQALLASTQPVDSLLLPETQIISKQERLVDGLTAIEMVSITNYTIHELFIQNGQTVINVAFRTLPNDYPQSEPLFRQAFQTIKIKRN